MYLKDLNSLLNSLGGVIECITTPSCSIALNGSLYGFIKGRKGLRQGDPLSPFLLVICLEYFSRILKGAIENSELNFHRKCDPLKIIDLAFVDDLMLFVGENVILVGILKDRLTNFRDMSVFKMNVNKSNLYTVGVYWQKL